MLLRMVEEKISKISSYLVEVRHEAVNGELITR